MNKPGISILAAATILAAAMLAGCSDSETAAVDTAAQAQDAAAPAATASATSSSEWASYGRDYSEGKKITWRDGFRALWCILKYRFT